MPRLVAVSFCHFLSALAPITISLSIFRPRAASMGRLGALPLAKISWHMKVGSGVKWGCSKMTSISSIRSGGA